MTVSAGQSAAWLARLGFAARGLVYLLVGGFAIEAALGGGRIFDNQGVMKWVAGVPAGTILLGLVAFGLAGYALWRLAEGVADLDRIGREGRAVVERAGHVASGLAHLVLAGTAGRLALDIRRAAPNAATPGDQGARDWTAWLLGQPFGRWLVAGIALAMLAAAAQQAHRAWTGRFADDLARDTPLPGYVCTVGRIGYAARAVVFAAVALLFATAAWQVRARPAGGIGQALAMLREQPGGDGLLAVTGVGLLLFGGYSLVEARFRQVWVKLPGEIR